MDLKLTAEEAMLQKWAVSQLVIKRRTGELGIIHGLDRFVATNVSLGRPLRRAELAALDAAVRKLGLGDELKRYEG